MSEQIKPIRVPQISIKVDSLLKLENYVFGDTGVDINQIGQLRKKELIELFEATYEKHLNLELNLPASHLRYLDNATELHWSAFKKVILEQRLAIARATTGKALSLAQVTNTFINGRLVSDGTVQFARRPFIKKSFAKACDEASKLADKYQSEFAVFGLHKTYGKGLTKPEDTKQKTNGRPASNPFSVMDELARIWVDGVNSDLNMPSGTCLTPDGKVAVTFTRQPSVVFDSYNQAIEYMNNWLQQYKQTTTLVESEEIEENESI